MDARLCRAAETEGGSCKDIGVNESFCLLAEDEGSGGKDIGVKGRLSYRRS